MKAEGAIVPVPVAARETEVITPGDESEAGVVTGTAIVLEVVVETVTVTVSGVAAGTGTGTGAHLPVTETGVGARNEGGRGTTSTLVETR